MFIPTPNLVTILALSSMMVAFFFSFLTIIDDYNAIAKKTRDFLTTDKKTDKETQYRRTIKVSGYHSFNNTLNRMDEHTKNCVLKEHLKQKNILVLETICVTQRMKKEFDEWLNISMSIFEIDPTLIPAYVPFNLENSKQMLTVLEQRRTEELEVEKKLVEEEREAEKKSREQRQKEIEAINLDYRRMVDEVDEKYMKKFMDRE